MLTKNLHEKIKIRPFLKGLRHEDFAILGQLCAKIITKCLYSYTKCSCKAMGKISNEFYQGELTITIFW